MREERLLVPGETVWRVERADRFACIIDGAAYFHHVKAAMLAAARSILLIGWDFDGRMTFERGDKTLDGPNTFDAFLRWLLRGRPALEIHMLKSNLGMVPALQTVWRGVTPVAVLNLLSSERMHFAVDGAHPAGAVHHQKIVVIDDVLAFCGGIDLTVDRWDTPEHADHSRLRRTQRRSYGPRHEVATAVDGAAARSLGELARERWRTATRRPLSAVDAADAVWPRGLEPTLRSVDVGIARTRPALNPGSEVREVEALNLAAVAAARDTIYLENQYLASRKLVRAIAARLQEADGPEIVIVMPRNSESRLEQSAMDTARYELLQLLWAADDHRHLGVYWPVTDGGTPVYVHAKVLTVDDRLLRIGSSNLNNRSMGFDSECDVAVEADPDDGADSEIRRSVLSLRHRLVSEHLGVSVGEFERELRRGGSFLRAIEALRGQGRTLQPFTDRTVAGEAGVLAENDLMDPDHVPRSVTESLQKFIAGLGD